MRSAPAPLQASPPMPIVNKRPNSFAPGGQQDMALMLKELYDVLSKAPAQVRLRARRPSLV